MITTTRLSELTGDYVLDTAHTQIGFIGADRVPARVGWPRCRRLPRLLCTH